MDTSELKKYTIVISSDEHFEGVSHTQIEYAKTLAKFANQIVFINPPANGISGFFDKTINTNYENINVIRYKKILPSSIGLFSKINEFINKIYISKKIKHHQNVLFWHFDPFRSAFDIKNSKHIYHIIDPYFNKPYDAILSKKSDLIVITNPDYQKHYLPYANKLIHIPQGVKEVVFSKTVNAKTKENILLVASLSDDIDWDLVYQLMLKLPNQKFILGGPVQIKDEHNMKVFEKIKVLLNVNYVGVVTDFTSVSNTCFLGLVPYKVFPNRDDKVRTPLKVLSYLNYNLVVASTIPCYIKELENLAIFNFETFDDFLNIIKKTKSVEMYNDKVHSYLLRMQYDNLIAEVISHV